MVTASQAGSDRLGLAVFTATTFLSALLLFSIQPLFAKMVLPVLGGAPAVWAVALLFFQTALLAGYAYAHALERYLPGRRGALVHLSVCLAALLVLPIGLPESWREPPVGDAYLWQLGLFTVAIGLPFTAVAANAPLLQAWFARARAAGSRDPYFLYAASNAGSLIALLGYPLVLEPAFGLTHLARAWTAGFVILILALAASAALALRAQPADAETLEAGSALAEELAPTWPRRLRWVGLAFVPAGLLTAISTHISTDIASAPLLWVVPLALYLATFIVVFRDRPLVPMSVVGHVHVVTVMLALLLMAQSQYTSLAASALLGLAAFTSASLVAHRALYEARPSPRHLTQFYLWMSAGGALGGLAAALLAPQVFPEVFEYPMLLALSLACRPGALKFRLDGAALERALPWLLGGLVFTFGLPWVAGKYEVDFQGLGATYAVDLVFAVLLLTVYRSAPRVLAAGLAMMLAVTILPSAVHQGGAQRSFFGVYRVMLSEDKRYNVLHHGTTLHGAQRIADDDLRPISNTTPMTYYHPKGPMAQAIGLVRGMSGEGGRYGVVGLGTGSLACYAREGEHWRLYEIDPLVADIARSPQFTFLATCQPEADIVFGDARLTLAREPDESFDLIVIDAFTSDAVPVHLLTAEAISLYASKLKPAGVAVFHISNRHLDLEGVVAATLPLVTPPVKAFLVEDKSEDAGYETTTSTVAVFSKDQAAAHAFLRIKGARTLDIKDMRAWTDDSSDILGPLISQAKRRLNPPPGMVAR